eukprot:TRINITY_DN7368_c0_g1_i1.p2 TRINITY_DN7368_c0_g1~~TRINITY_DN7368_c0_g1_i1.p2  ORF type:complete len:351 (+),score=152.61 TRINITY_DN7368_c0_g1_i1:41-1054(+)
MVEPEPAAEATEAVTAAAPEAAAGGSGSVDAQNGSAAVVEAVIDSQSLSNGDGEASVATTSRLKGLKAMLIARHRDKAQRGESFKGIVFVQHRITTHILNHFVASDAELSALFRSACAYAAGTPAAAGLRMSSTDLRDRFTNFRLGHFNLIFATCVAEEGLDLPCANCVIRFDPMHTPVSYVQGRGRAREAGSDFAVLMEMRARPVSQLKEAEAMQTKVFARNANAAAASTATAAAAAAASPANGSGTSTPAAAAAAATNKASGGSAAVADASSGTTTGSGSSSSSSSDSEDGGEAATAAAAVIMEAATATTAAAGAVTKAAAVTAVAAQEATGQGK